MPKKRVLLVDDNAIIRKAVRPLFNSHPKFAVCGEAEHGREAVEKAPSLRPDLIVRLGDAYNEWSRSRTTADKNPASRLAHTVNVPRLAWTVSGCTFGWDTRRGSKERGGVPLDRTGRSALRHDPA